jgi:transcriptional regulator NrdR family protein
MQCPRCLEKLQNVIEYYIQEEDFTYTRDYYCMKCKSSLIEHFDERGLFRSEWIDFNV